MGLDQYLYKRTYLKNWDHMQPSERHEITVTKGGKPTEIKPERIAYIIEEVGYWRKANAIHAWFVKHVQGGQDDCREYYVSPEQLAELLATVKQVLASCQMVDGPVNAGYTLAKGAGDGRLVKKPILEAGQFIVDPSVAINLLPSQDGFFFGGTDYDSGYVEDLKQTVKILEPLLNEEEGEFYYDSSW